MLFHAEQLKGSIMKKKAMGRGLDALFESNTTEESNGVTVLNISDVEINKNQPRKNFDQEALNELAESIKVHGIIQPIVVRSAGDGFYVIVAGERRYRAAKIAGLTEIPVIIMDISQSEAAEVALIENIQRKDLNPIEEAAAYKSIIEEYKMTQQEFAERIGKPRTSVTNMLRLLDLPDVVMEYVASGKITTGHAKELMALKDKEMLVQATETVIKLNLNVRATASYVKKLNEPKKVEIEDPREKSYEHALSERMFGLLGHKVKINKGKKHTLEITYTDNDDLENLIKRICGDDVFEF